LRRGKNSERMAFKTDEGKKGTTLSEETEKKLKEPAGLGGKHHRERH